MAMIELITWPRVVLLISGIGIYFLNFRRDKKGFIFFAISAIGWAVYDVRLGASEQALVMLFSAFTSFAGYFKWWYDEKKEKNKRMAKFSR